MAAEAESSRAQSESQSKTHKQDKMETNILMGPHNGCTLGPSLWPDLPKEGQNGTKQMKAQETQNTVRFHPNSEVPPKLYALTCSQTNHKNKDPEPVLMQSKCKARRTNPAADAHSHAQLRNGQSSSSLNKRSIILRLKSSTFSVNRSGLRLKNGLRLVPVRQHPAF